MILGKSTRAVILGGVFFLIPLLVIIFVLKQALGILLPFVRRLVGFFGIHSIFGAATVTILSILVLVLFCYLSGLLLKNGLVNDWSSKMEDRLYLMFPSLQMLKYKLLGEKHNQKKEGRWQAIMLREEDYYLIGFITSKNKEGFLSLFMPDAPKMEGGEIRIIHETKCDFIPISMKRAMQALNSFGRDGDLGEALSIDNLKTE